MTALSSGQALGGAVVTFSGDINPLKQAVAQAKQAMQALSAPVVITITANATALAGVAGQIKQALAAVTTINLTAAFNAQAASASLTTLTRQLQMQANAAPVIIPVQYGNPGPTPGGTPGAGPPPGPPRGGGPRGTGFPRGFGRLLGAMAAFRAAEGAFQAIEKAPEYGEAVRKQSPHVTADELIIGSSPMAGGPGTSTINPFSGRATTNASAISYGALSELPLLGPVIKSIAGAVVSGPLADAQRLSEKSERFEAQAEKIKGITTGIARNEDAAAVVGASPETKFAVEANQRRVAIEEEIGKLGSKQQQELGPAARAALERLLSAQLGQVQKEINNIIAGYQSRNQISITERRSAQAMARGTGGEDIQWEDQRIEARMKLQEEQRKEMEKEEDPGRKNQLRAVQENELAAFDEKIANERKDRERQTGLAIAAEVEKGQEAILTAEHRGYEARSLAFETEANKRIAAVRTKSAEEQQAVVNAIAQQRQAMDIVAAEHVSDFIAKQHGGIAQAGGQGFAASLSEGITSGQRDIQGMPQRQEIKPGTQIPPGTIVVSRDGTPYRATGTDSSGRTSFTNTATGASRILVSNEDLARVGAIINPQMTATEAMKGRVAAQVAAENQKIAIQRNDLIGEAAEASLRGQGMAALASTDEQIRSIKDRVLTSSPALFAQEKATAQAKLAAMGQELGGLSSGGVAVEESRYQRHAASPYEAQERQRQKADIDKAGKDIAGMSPSEIQQNANKLLGTVNEWLEKIFNKPGSVVIDGMGG